MSKDYEDIINMDRPVIKIPGMEVAHRAKIFAPFAALKGFEECVRDKEVLYEIRRTLSDDQNERLNQYFCTLQNGDLVTVTYFKPSSSDEMIGQYITIEGTLGFTKIPTRIQIDDIQIEINDLIEIKNNTYYK